MKRLVLVVLALFVLTSMSTAQKKSSTKSRSAKKYPIGGSYPSGSKIKVVPDLDKRLAKFKAVQMPFNKAKLSAREVKMVNKLVEASRYLDSIYWRQSDPEGLTMLQQLAGSS